MRDEDRQGQGRRVGQHVPGVGQQGQTARDQTADDLDDEKRRDDAQGDPQTPAGDPAEFLAVVMAAIVAMEFVPPLAVVHIIAMHPMSP